MNTQTEIDRLTSDICERFGLTLMEVMDVRVDLSAEYLKGLVAYGWLAAPEDATLMVLVPDYWAWWLQRWANRDRNLLENVTKLALLEWDQTGNSRQELYCQCCQDLANCTIYPNSVLMDAFHAEKRKQETALSTLKTLFHA